MAGVHKGGCGWTPQLTGLRRDGDHHPFVAALRSGLHHDQRWSSERDYDGDVSSSDLCLQPGQHWPCCRDHGRVLRAGSGRGAHPALVLARGEGDRVSDASLPRQQVITLSPKARDRTRIGRLGPSRLRTAVNYLVMVPVTILFVSPVIYMFIASFKPNNEVLSGFGVFSLQDLSFNNYLSIFSRFTGSDTGTFTGFLTTSLIVSAATVIGGLVVNSMAAYSFAPLRSPCPTLFLLAALPLVIFPFAAFAVPLFYHLAVLRNTYLVPI